jgi:V/A-type H+-transporting ATPase subunit I
MTSPTTSRLTLEQKRAAHAWSKAGEGVARHPTDYVNDAKGLPALIMNSGLMQVMAYLQGKGGRHLTLADHLLFTYLERGESSHVVIVGPRGEQEGQLQALLSSAGFQPLPIPEGLADTDPARKHDELAEQRAALEAERAALHDEVERWHQQHRELLLEARRTLLLAEPFVALDPSIRSAGHLAVLAGWVPARAVARLEQRLRETLAMPFELAARDPRPEERALVPSVPVTSRLLAPFATLVKQYGIPQYGEIDPTPLFAFTFLLMFGSMFGDVGQGAVIAVLAWAFRRKLGRFATFGVMAGLSSVLFGFLYGSLFGYEEILPALWQSPIHHPLLMLKIALGYGVVFLVAWRWATSAVPCSAITAWSI